MSFPEKQEPNQHLGPILYSCLDLRLLHLHSGAICVSLCDVYSSLIDKHQNVLGLVTVGVVV